MKSLMNINIKVMFIGLCLFLNSYCLYCYQNIKIIRVNRLHSFRSSLSNVSPENDQVEKTKVRSGYIPPELDPEYRNVVIKSSRTFNKKIKKESNQLQDGQNEDDIYSSYPVPKEGDIVLYKGKWGDNTLGRIRFLQYVASYENFFADIVHYIIIINNIYIYI